VVAQPVAVVDPPPRRRLGFQSAPGLLRRRRKCRVAPPDFVQVDTGRPCGLQEVVVQPNFPKGNLVFASRQRIGAQLFRPGNLLRGSCERRQPRPCVAVSCQSGPHFSRALQAIHSLQPFDAAGPSRLWPVEAVGHPVPALMPNRILRHLKNPKPLTVRYATNSGVRDPGDCRLSSLAATIARGTAALIALLLTAYKPKYLAMAGSQLRRKLSDAHVPVQILSSSCPRLDWVVHVRVRRCLPAIPGRWPPAPGYDA